ncbi:MAG TPA: ISAs1 family transposase, partial [Porphyromonadaceae bacterium]|nr:ISAs1 family transposase [Porphyromonadaceae bacterium]
LAHGRIETKCYEMIPSLLTLEPNEILSRWTDLQSIVKVTRTREFKKTCEKRQEISYYISSEHEMSRLKDAIKNHWSIENNLHHCLDVYFLQDAS